MGLLLTTFLALLQAFLPRSYAFAPLIIATYHLPNIEYLPELTPARLITLVGLLRAATSGFLALYPKTRLDIALITFALLALASAPFHTGGNPFVYRAGLVLNVLGTFWYAKSYLPDLASFTRLALVSVIAVLPLAALLAIEKSTARNQYAPLGLASDAATVRNDRIRAMGPFRHPILAGTAGAATLPLTLIVYKYGNPRLALVGGVAAVTAVYASASSGPMAAAALLPLSLFLWRRPSLLKLSLYILPIIALCFPLISATNRGPWYLISYIDLVGGSTGWHRAQLIDQALAHLPEWWLFGTDRTRHWMPTGVSWNPEHTDLTNYYIHLGVIGGLPLTLCLLTMIALSFATLRRCFMLATTTSGLQTTYLLWIIGTLIAIHALSFISISYFDQMYVLFYLPIGLCSNLQRTPGFITPSNQAAP